MRTATVFASFVCLAALAQPAEAQFSQIVVTDGAGWRQVSGVRGEARRTYSAPPGAALSSLEYGERADKPCFLKMNWLASGTVPPATYNTCGGAANQVERVVAWPHVVRQIRVCNRNSNKRIKGLRLLRAEFSATGSLENRSQRGAWQHARTNCNNNWAASTSSCPTGQAVTKLRLEVNARPGPDEIVGISAFCSRVRAVPTQN